MKSCMTCGSSDDLRAPLKGWVAMGSLPEIICSKCFSDWHDGKPLTLLKENEISDTNHFDDSERARMQKKIDDLTRIAECAEEMRDAAEAKLSTAVEALKKCQFIKITDGCEECSSVWQREYGLNVISEALTKIGEV